MNAVGVKGVAGVSLTKREAGPLHRHFIYRSGRKVKGQGRRCGVWGRVEVGAWGSALSRATFCECKRKQGRRLRWTAREEVWRSEEKEGMEDSCGRVGE